MIQITDEALSEMHSLSQRMKELAVQSSSGTYNDDDRKLMNKEFSNLKKEMDRIACETEFNGRKLMDGTLLGIKIEGQKFKDLIKPGGTNSNLDHIDAPPQELAKLGRGEFVFSVDFDDYINQIPEKVTISVIDNTFEEPYVVDSIEIKNPGENETRKLDIAGITITFKGQLTAFADGIIINNTPKKVGYGSELQVGSDSNQIVGLSIDNMKVRELGLLTTDILTQEDVQDSLEKLDNAINIISNQRASIGATQNRLEHTVENLQAAESRIRDVDMAKEMMNLTKLNVLHQASQAMLSQANQAPQQVLSILR